MIAKILALSLLVLAWTLSMIALTIFWTIVLIVALLKPQTMSQFQQLKMPDLGHLLHS